MSIESFAGPASPWPKFFDCEWQGYSAQFYSVPITDGCWRKKIMAGDKISGIQCGQQTVLLDEFKVQLWDAVCRGITWFPSFSSH
jgi:hypothetical protein